MADNKEQEKQITTSIKKIKEPDFSKEVVIDKLLADKRAVDFHFNRMKKEFGDKLTDQQINERIHNLVVRDNVFNAAMHILVPCYEITIDPKHLQAMVDSLLNVDPKLKDAPEGFAKALAKNMMEKEMIFAAVAKEWNIQVSDEELKNTLNEYYRQTNKPIRDILNDSKRMNSLRQTILEEKIADSICKKLKFKLDKEAILKNATASQQAAKEASAKSKEQASAKQEKK